MKTDEELQLWRAHIQKFVEHFGHNNKADTVLDIGCGDSTKILRSIYANVKTMDTRDIADYSLDICDPNNFPLPESFPIVFCLEVLEHTRKPWIVAANLLKLVQSGGKLVISVPSFLFHHPMWPYCGDYWRFLPEHVECLFDGLNCNKIQQSICPKLDRGHPLGMCYVLEVL